MDNEVKVRFKNDAGLSIERLEKFNNLVLTTVKDNIDIITNTIEYRLPHETVGYILEVFVDHLIPDIYEKQLGKDLLLKDIRNGYFITFRNMLFKAFRKDAVVNFYKKEEIKKLNELSKEVKKRKKLKLPMGG